MVTGLTLAMCTYQSLYPVSLIFPAVIALYDRDVARKEGEGTNVCFKKSAVKTVLCFIVPFVVLLIESYAFTKSWQFADSTFGFM